MTKENNDARHDPLDTEYSVIATFEKATTAVFWATVVLSLVVLHVPQSLLVWHQLATVCFILLVIVHFGLGITAKTYLMPRVEAKRRKMLVSDGLGIPLEPERPTLYYNNHLDTSIGRLGADVMENAFFARAVSGKMAGHSRIILSIYLVIWLGAALWRQTDLGFIVLLAQVLFSGEILAAHIRLEVLRSGSGRIFDNLYSVFLHSPKADSRECEARILESYASYEAAKSFAGILQSTAIFKTLNADLSSKWDEVTQKLGMGSPDKDND